ncbi:dihydrofolate reductase family protein [Paradesertivirga mongoliensis]|uniref:Dihydrofolate reductase family protein n=1 Tax=Paradesertivirga mongoliensis TaxID=2100740 RepID=A0ABW4ZLU0_9SPHI|nr:dihydrofolate reductase family protein [Pedobacter mongoliensis]
MKRIILDLTVSLDGYIEGKNRETDWIIFDDEIGRDLCNFAGEIDAILYGRVSYELYGNYLPSEGAGTFEKEFYSRINKLQKFVFSTKRQITDVNSIVIAESIVKRVNEIKARANKDIWLFGGSGLITTLLNLDLIDEIRIGINPIILGEGTPLFKEIKSRKKLKLLQIKEYQSGVIGLYYETIRDSP